MKSETSWLVVLAVVFVMGVASNVQAALAELVFEKKLIASDTSAGDQFDSGVGISQRTVIVGADGNDDDASGAAYIYQRNFGGSLNWGKVMKLTTLDAAEGDRFSQTVGILGNNVVLAGIDGGNVAGGYPDGIRHGFIATIPEPAALSLLSVGILLACSRRRSVLSTCPRRELLTGAAGGISSSFA